MVLESRRSRFTDSHRDAHRDADQWIFEHYNTAFSIFPDCNGDYVVFSRLTVVNEIAHIFILIKKCCKIINKL